MKYSFLKYGLLILLLFTQQAKSFSIINLPDTTVVDTSKLVLQDSLHVQHDFVDIILLKESLNKTDYRNFSDNFLNAPFGYVKDFGMLGQQNNFSLFGSGVNNVGVLIDGISFNSPTQNNFDSFLFSTENFNRLEVYSLAKGFVFNSHNNSVSINIVPEQRANNFAYSRLRYYQAPLGESNINAIFSINPFKKLNVEFEISNFSADYRYKNSEFGSWGVNGKLSYALNAAHSLSASIRHFKSKTQLNGGVDYDSILVNYESQFADDILYSRFQAPVMFDNRYQKSTDNYYDVKLNSNFSNNWNSQLTFYYRSSLLEFRQNERAASNELLFDNSEKVFGINILQRINSGLISAQLISSFEYDEYNLQAHSLKSNQTQFSLGALVRFNFIDDYFAPEISAKYLSVRNKWFKAYGISNEIKLNANVKFYAGASIIDKPFSLLEEALSISFVDELNQISSNVEGSLRFSNDIFTINGGVFYQSFENWLMPFIRVTNKKYYAGGYENYSDITLQGASLKFEVHYWKFLFSSGTSFYSNSSEYFQLPQFNSSGGIYYVDTLFNTNLKLKAGINYNLFGERSFSLTDITSGISSSRIVNTEGNLGAINYSMLPTDYQFDLFIAANIQNSATIYITFENLLDRNYYIVPYFPKQPRGLRIGVAWEFLD
jgi:hypothetical protein